MRCFLTWLARSSTWSCRDAAGAAAILNALAPALVQATCLVQLHLDYDYLLQQGAQWLVPVLSGLPHLSRINCRAALESKAAWPWNLPSRTGTACVRV